MEGRPEHGPEHREASVTAGAVKSAAASVAERRRFLRRGVALAVGAVSGAARAETPNGGEIRLRKLYEKNLSFTPLAESLDGEIVAVRGFMAPPLKAGASFFVLTKRPMAICPFCDDAADWPNDIVAVHTKREVRIVPFNADIVVRGRLSLGDERDPETGFFSRLRLVDAVVERV